MELLVVIAIIAVLIALSFPVYVRMTDSADSTKCVGNLRQIATAMSLYTTDNDGYITPNIFLNQSPLYTKDPRYLEHPQKLGPYLNLEPPTSWSVVISEMSYAEVFECPARKRMDVHDHNQSLRTNRAITLADGTANTDPWGSGTAASVTFMSVKLVQIMDPATTWALMDCDQQIPGIANLPWNTAPTPVHKHHRNAIFFDWHVGMLDLDNNLK